MAHGPPVDRDPGPGTAFDPVDRHSVSTGDAGISAVYHDRAYYFERSY